MRLYPPVYLLGSLLAQAALHFGTPVVRVLPRTPAVLGGALVMTAGLFLLFLSASYFFRRKTTILPFEASSALITQGPFRVSRNPIYLAMTLVLCGFAGFCGTLSPWLIPPLFVLLITQRFIRLEERMLEERFGAAYLAYKAQVRRWI